MRRRGGRAPRSRRRGRAGRRREAAGAGGGVLCAVLLLPGVLEGLELGVRFIMMDDGVGLRTGEQFPLFDLFGRASPTPARSWQ